MKNEKWYYYDKNGKCQLTDKAPLRAVLSYKQFNETLENHKKRNLRAIRNGVKNEPSNKE
jgi:hypothetical protein